MAIRCGHCGGEHESAVGVHCCAGAESAAGASGAAVVLDARLDPAIGGAYDGALAGATVRGSWCAVLLATLGLAAVLAVMIGTGRF